MTLKSLEPYSAYQPSPHLLLPTVPAHWTVRSLASISSRRTGSGRPDLPLMSVLREKGVVLRSSLSDEENRNVVPEDLSNYRVALAGDLVINKMKAWQGSLGIAPADGIVSPAYFVFELRIENKYYGQRLLRSRPYVGLFGSASDGVRVGQWDLSISQMKRVPVLIPPPEEQRAIVRFLDHSDKQIRKYIRAKQKLIKLLEEQKQAIIHQAVTQGLDPNVTLKPSRIEWIGDVPEHWGMVLNQRIFKEKIRPFDGTAEVQLSLSQRDGLIATSSMRERSLQTSSFDNWKVTVPGDLVLNRFKAHLGVFFAATLRGIVSFHYGVFAARVPLVSKYYELLFHTNPYRIIFAGRSNGMTVGLQNLSNQNFYNVRSPVPPVTEQITIVEYCGSATASLEETIRKARQEIALLRELGIRLTTDVVTGKLDVRAAAADLPDEPEEAFEDVEQQIADIDDADTDVTEAAEVEE